MAAESTAAGSSKAKSKPLGPTDSDTQLLTALRQVSSRFGRRPPAGVVLFSDGRARDERGAEQLAAQFAKLNVPVHVVPVGDTANGGRRGDRGLRRAASRAALCRGRGAGFLEKLRLRRASLPDEVSMANNSFKAEVQIDRTKIRLLYIEGNSQPWRTWEER